MKEWVQKYILNNLVVKVASLAAAIILWLVVVNVSDPVVDTTYTDIPLTVVNADSITSDGKVYEMVASNMVTISVSAKRSILDSLSGDNFKAEADLSLFNEETGMVPVKVSSNRYSDKIESIRSKTESVEVLVEDGLRKQFVITPEVSGEPAEDYIIGNVSTAENVVRISGRESVVSKIAKVTAEVSVDGLDSDVNTSVDLKLYDEDGEQIKNSNLVKNISTVAIAVEILATKDLEIRYNYTGKPADGYMVYGSVTGNMSTVKVAGRNSDLQRVNYLDIGNPYLDVTGLSETTEVSVDLEKAIPESLSLVNKENNVLNITIPIQQLVEREVVLQKSAVKIGKLEGSLKAELMADRTISFTVTGVQSAISALSISDVKASVDWDAYMDENGIAEITPGTYRLPLTITLPEDITTVKEVMVSLRVTENE
ncbi:MAG: hypothetical protein K6E18_03455 [Lachnospiraceae bacterium]|nr:hypothetical protein [Lachnospiraceae bacterium]